MDAKTFLEEVRRMCKVQKGCVECALSALCDGGPIEWSLVDVGDAIEAVEKWSQEHPRKTRLQDFLEKYPNAPLNGNGIPCLMPWNVGYCGDTSCYACKEAKSKPSAWCWDQEVEDDETD